MKDKLKIILTGGGTAGHVLPHFPLIPLMQNKGWYVAYIGSSGIEKSLILERGLDFFTIRSGKLRRYFSVQNFFDIFNVLLGCVQASYVLFKVKPHLVFSKGGYVSLPVAVAAWLLRIPVVTHESDMTPGLANKFISKIAKVIMYSFPETVKYLPSLKAMHTGIPVRGSLLLGKKNKAFELCQFDAKDKKPVILVVGGSTGARSLNGFIFSSSKALLQKYRIIHLTGNDSHLKKIEGHKGHYWQAEYVKDELKDLLQAADVVVSRSGANTIFELLTLKKKMVLVPLSKGSRGDQILNAKSFFKRGWASIILEEELTLEKLVEEIDSLLMKDSIDDKRHNKIDSFLKADPSKEIIKIIEKVVLV